MDGGSRLSEATQCSQNGLRRCLPSLDTDRQTQRPLQDGATCTPLQLGGNDSQHPSFICVSPAPGSQHQAEIQVIFPSLCPVAGCYEAGKGVPERQGYLPSSASKVSPALH